MYKVGNTGKSLFYVLLLLNKTIILTFIHNIHHLKFSSLPIGLSGPVTLGARVGLDLVVVGLFVFVVFSHTVVSTYQVNVFGCRSVYAFV